MSAKRSDFHQRKCAAKRCGVCGDKALGYNFNAISCESCKAFFRRNALKSKEQSCPFSDNCNVTVVTRRFCQKCRLRKCFQIGMKKEWILSDDEKKLKRAKSTTNRNRRGTNSSDVEPAFELTNSVEASSSSPFSESDLVQEDDVTVATALKSLLGQVANSSTDSPSESNSNLLTPAKNQCASSSSSSIPDIVFDKAVAAEFVDHPLRRNGDQCKLRDKNNDKCRKALTNLEQSKLDELIVANEVLKEPFNTVLHPSLLDVVKMTDYAIRRLIVMSKQLASFMELCQEDQIALLKGGCTELMILRSVMSYNPEKDCWQLTKDNKCKFLLKLDVLKQANIYEAHKSFITSFAVTWRSDDNIMLLLCAITLFTPDRSNVIHKDIIRFHQQTYMYLLKTYLETVYDTTCDARGVYLKLMAKIEELHVLNEDHIKIYLNINPNDVGPLLIEIFDLKN